MKRVLQATTALAGGLAMSGIMVSGAAMADAPVVSFSGALTYEAIFSDGDVADAGTGINITANEQQSELVWDARGSADNGLNYRANIQWRWANGGAGAAGTFDEAWIDFTGDFGRLYIGGEDGVEDLIAGTAGHNVTSASSGTDGNNALRHVNFLGMNTALLYYNSSANFTSDSNKIGYITPNFGGFRAGVHYAPNNTFLQRQGRDDQATNNMVGLAAGWAGAFGDVTLGVDGSYGIGDDAAGVNGAAQEDIAAYHVGGIVSFAGVSLAGSYFNSDESGCPTATANCDAGDGWNIGIGYVFGPGSVSLMWQDAEDDTDGNGQADTATILYGDVDYRLAEGLSTYLGAYWFDLENESGSGVATNSNEAHMVILGTRITF